MTYNPKSITHNLPLVVIVGPTASGKSALAVTLAKKYDAEIICADSRTVYKGMNIGTAKPSIEDQTHVPHWGLDIVKPGERFSAADFKVYAEQKIKEIRSRGHIPILVGGTGLYVDAVILNYSFGSQVDENLRHVLQQKSIDELISYCIDHHIELPENERNKRYLIRAIEQPNRLKVRLSKPNNNTIVVGITTDKVLLRNRIEQRTEQLLQDGVVNEAKMLGKKYGWESEAMTSNIYPLIYQHIRKEITISELKAKNITQDWRLAKRQLTWLRRHDFIKWYSLFDAEQYLSDYLAKRV